MISVPAQLSRVRLVTAITTFAMAARMAPATDSLPTGLPADPWHLTARPWTPVSVSPSDYLDRLGAECRYWLKQQNSSGAIIDPITQKEVGATTPCYADAVGTLLRAGRITASDPLYASGILAINHSIPQIVSSGNSNFYISPLTESPGLYKSSVTTAQYNTWFGQMSNLFKDDAAAGNTNNWEAYYMQDVWQQAQAGLITTSTAQSEIENRWTGSQQARITSSRWNLYHDTSSDPDSLAVEAVGRGNLVALDYENYNGPSAAAIKTAVETGSLTSLLMQDPSGQAPANGRTDDHVWVDGGNQTNDEMLAHIAQKAGNTWLAGQYESAAVLSFSSMNRWLRSDPTYGGTFYVTKNQFDPTLRVGYQTASQYSNYNGTIMFSTAEAYNIVSSAAAIKQNPSPSVIGGYAFATDTNSTTNHGFATAFANAGGTAMEIDLRGDTPQISGNYWNSLGVVRFGRPNWDTRLGPSDGAYTSSNVGVTFAPTWLESGSWIRLASVPDRYAGTFTTSLATPVLTKCTVVWAPLAGKTGPIFTQNFTITPDGIFSQTTQTGASSWGMTFPLLQSDGATTLNNVIANGIASASYPGSTDEEDFIMLNTAGAALSSGTSVRSSYGDLDPVQATSTDSTQNTFVYPRGAGDPTASAVKAGFKITATGFTSPIGTVDGTLYIGRTSAGGIGQSIDLNADGISDVTFSSSCTFILQLNGGVVTNVETDRAESAMIQGHIENLAAYTPVTITIPEPSMISILLPIGSMLALRRTSRKRAITVGGRLA